MNPNELIEILEKGGLKKYSRIYSDIKQQTSRYINAIKEFMQLYGADRDVSLFSVPGRSELSGNHTDHNCGCVLAGAIDRDIIAVAAKSDEGVIRVCSEGYDEDKIKLSSTINAKNFENGTSRALIAGMCGGFEKNSYKIGGFDAYTTTMVLKGSGLSSSAAFEVMIGNILNHFYNDAQISNEKIAKIAQYSENEYFGKPCGLMDQMACAVGGFVFIDFADPREPMVVPIKFSLDDAGYNLCIVNTKGNHAELTSEYAAVPSEMKAVAAHFGKDVLRFISEEEIIRNIQALRDKLGDRAVLRALHFVRENKRVILQARCLQRDDIKGFLAGVLDSGNSSFKYLQNIYSSSNPKEQGLSLALCLTEGELSGKNCAWRVHGGGFAGTIQAFVTHECSDGYANLLNSVFGDDASMILNIREAGAIEVIL